MKVGEIIKIELESSKVKISREAIPNMLSIQTRNLTKDKESTRHLSQKSKRPHICVCVYIYSKSIPYTFKICVFLFKNHIDEFRIILRNLLVSFPIVHDSSVGNNLYANENMKAL